MLNMLLFNAALLLACGYALLRGAGPERTVALLLVGAAAASLAIGASRRQFSQVEYGILLVDLVLLAGLVAVALRANRFWPIWLTSLHTVAFAFHGVRAYLPELPDWTYQRAVSLIAYPMLLILVIGCIRHRQRIQQRGEEPSWSVLR